MREATGRVTLFTLDWKLVFKRETLNYIRLFASVTPLTVHAAGRTELFTKAPLKKKENREVVRG